MNSKLTQLVERRKTLLQQAETQRRVMAEAAEPWRHLLVRVDQGVAILHYVKSHPAWLAAGAGTLLAVFGPRRVWRWVGQGLVGLQMVGKLRIR